MQKYRQIICNTYRSLEHPDFSFVKRAFGARPYDPLIKRLRDFGVVEELVQAEDDVCFSYLLKGQSSLWGLDLSIVGLFAIFVRVKGRVSADDFLYPGRIDLTGFETKVLDLLAGAGVKLMTTEELSVEMPMTLYNTNRNNVKLYQALFSDRELPPWEV
ncbi:MAG: hypothetical protein NTY08_15015 [Proteobacteria bacterium]|nr:hypothetical protein [Pseudomonadota bacterium]